VPNYVSTIREVNVLSNQASERN